MSIFLTILYSQFFVTPVYPSSDFTGQVLIVTGSNTGLGFEAVKHLIRLNAAKIILAVRALPKGESAVQKIVEETNCDSSRLEVWPLDLSKFDSVKAFGARVRKLERLDGVIQNAGILTSKWEEFDGHESHVTVNVVSAALLGLEVLPKLRESAKRTGLRGRLAFVGSDLQYLAKFKEKRTKGRIFDALDAKDSADMGDRYSVSKLLLFYYVRILATLSPLSPDSNVIITILTPGACTSDIFRDEVGWFQKVVMSIAMSLLARTTEVGSRTLVHGVQPDLEAEAHGAFLMNDKIKNNGANVDGVGPAKVQEIFSQELFEILENIEPGITINTTSWISG